MILVFKMKIKDKLRTSLLAIIPGTGAGTGGGSGSSPFGRIEAPEAISKYGDSPQGLFTFLNNLLKLLVIGAGFFVLFNIILAGYGFLTAGGDSEKVSKALEKIWMSALGLVIVAGAFVIAGVIGLLIFGDARALLVPKLYGPD